MTEWWEQLSGLNQALYVSAIFFSTLLLLQFVFLFADSDSDGDGADDSAGHGPDLDADADSSMDVSAEAGSDAAADAHHDAHPAHHGAADVTEVLWRGMLSQRSLFAFATLFSWAGALYLQAGEGLVSTLVISGLWGLGGSAVVALMFFAIDRLKAETAESLEDTVGQDARVMLEIPSEGQGKVRLLVGGRLQHVQARALQGGPFRRGSTVVVASVEGNVVAVISPAALTASKTDALPPASSERDV